MAIPEAHDFGVDFTVSLPDTLLNLCRIHDLLCFVAVTECVQGQLGVWICTDEEIADLHLRYMKIPGATDVITFAADAPGSGGYLGDVAVSIETARMQAQEVAHSTEREVAYLCVHGLLHIAGYEDQDERSRAQMLAKQEELLNGFERENPGEWTLPPGS